MLRQHVKCMRMRSSLTMHCPAKDPRLQFMRNLLKAVSVHHAEWFELSPCPSRIASFVPFWWQMLQYCKLWAYRSTRAGKPLRIEAVIAPWQGVMIRLLILLIQARGS